MGTNGENRTYEILCRLPAPEFSCYYEPGIEGPRGTTRYPDFLIIWRSRGVLAVEVKDYKRFNLDQSDQAEIQIITNYGEVRREPNPLRTAKRYSDNIINLFEKRKELLHYHDGFEKLSFPCEGIVILANICEDYLVQMITRGIFSPNMVLPAEVLQSVQNLQKYLEKVPWIWKLRNPLTEDSLETIRHEIKMTCVNREGKKIGDLNQNQEDLLYRPLPLQDGGYSADLVRGSVGSGKTIVLTKRAELLKKTRPELNILVCAFNIDLTQDLRAKITNPNIRVVAFFDLCKEILGNKYPKLEKYRDELGPRTIKKWVHDQEELMIGEGIKPETVSEEIARRKDKNLFSDDLYKDDIQARRAPFTNRQIEILCILYDEYIHYQDELKREGIDPTDYEDTTDLTLSALFGHKLERSFDVIMIDEAQDWSPKWIRIIKRLLKPGGNIFLCDDPAQSLWRSFTWEQKGIKGYDLINLELPERTTKEIMDCAQLLFDIDDNLHANYEKDVYPVKTDHLLRGNKPKVIIYKSKDEEKAGITSIIQKEFAELKANEKIGVLCPRYEDIENWKEDQLVKEKGVYIKHFNVMKGLEFQTVIIPCIDQLFRAESRPDDSYELSNLRKLFVAMTRARRELILTCSGSFPEKLDPLLKLCTVAYGWEVK